MAPRNKLGLIYLVGLLAIVAALSSQVESLEATIRAKRQTGQRPQIPTSISAQGNAQASASSLSSALTADGQLGASRPEASAVARPKKPKVTTSMAEADAEAEMSLEDEDAPVRVPKPRRKKKRPSNRRPPPVDSRHEDDDDDEGHGDDYEDCHDSDYDYGHGFPEAAMRPMRHFGRMMNGMFSQMRGLAAAGKLMAK